MGPIFCSYSTKFSQKLTLTELILLAWLACADTICRKSSEKSPRTILTDHLFKFADVMAARSTEALDAYNLLTIKLQRA